MSLAKQRQLLVRQNCLDRTDPDRINRPAMKLISKRSLTGDEGAKEFKLDQLVIKHNCNGAAVFLTMSSIVQLT